MSNIQSLTQYFLLALGLGTFAFSPLVSSRLTGAGFQRLVVSVSLGAVVLAGVVGFFETENVSLIYVGLYLISSVLFILFSASLRDEPRFISRVFYFMQLFVLGTLALELYLFYEHLFYYFLITTALVGIINYTMILGHYYLVVPKLTERPLIIGTYLIWAFLLVKLVVSLVSLYNNWDYLQEGSLKGEGYLFNWIIFSMRFLWGYVAIAVLNIFAYKLCKIRSIQSATGVFYIMVFFMLIGELMSSYIYFNLRLFI
jgi:hypothetical protein